MKKRVLKNVVFAFCLGVASFFYVNSSFGKTSIVRPKSIDDFFSTKYNVEQINQMKKNISKSRSKLETLYLKLKCTKERIQEMSLEDIESSGIILVNNKINRKYRKLEKTIFLAENILDKYLKNNSRFDEPKRRKDVNKPSPRYYQNGRLENKMYSA